MLLAGVLLHATLLIGFQGPCPDGWVVATQYVSASGEALISSEIICGADMAEARMDEIEAKGFRLDEFTRISHSAVRRIERWPIREFQKD